MAGRLQVQSSKLSTWLDRYYYNVTTTITTTKLVFVFCHIFLAALTSQRTVA